MKQPPPNLQNYNELYRTFRWANVLPTFSFHATKKVNYAYEVLDYQCQQGKAKNLALVVEKRDGSIVRKTFAELATETNILASWLQQQGLRAGERFVIYAPRSLDYARILYAALKSGAIVVPLFEAFGSTAIQDRLDNCEASWIFTTENLVANVPQKHLPKLTHVLFRSDFPDLQGDEPKELPVIFSTLETGFIIHYTSGSTAKPKGVLLPQRSMIGHRVTAQYVLDLHPADRFWNTGDPGWVTGMVYNFFAPLLEGVACHILEEPFNPIRWIRFMKKHKISVWYSTPTAFRLLRYYNVPLNRASLPSLRHVVSAGEPLNANLIDWTMKNLGIPIYDSWYMTENGHQLINNYRCLPIKKGSMGKPLPGIVVDIRNRRGQSCSVGIKGRLMIKTPWPGLMKTIWKNKRKFDSYFEKGWYISGDIAYKDDNGYIWFQGREDDMIKSGAERISPFEIESVLTAHPDVVEAGVIGVPDSLYGNVVKAFIVLKKGKMQTSELLSSIRRYVQKNLAPHQVPREISVIKALPKTRSGKIMRRVLRVREIGGQEGDLSTMDTEMMRE